MSESRVEVDWVHLPAGVEPRSLWSCLHDTELTAASSDIWNRSLVLEFNVLHLLEHHRLPDDLRFRFCLSEVRAVRAAAFVYPEPPPPNGVAGDCTSRVRDESVSWG